MIETCRLCLCTEKRMLPIFAETEASRRIRLRIVDCCSIELVQDTLLPGRICEDCETKVTGLYEFREQCRKSEETLLRSYDRKLGKFLVDGKTFRDASVQTEPFLDQPCPSRNCEDISLEQLDGKEEEFAESLKNQENSEQVSHEEYECEKERALRSLKNRGAEEEKREKNRKKEKKKKNEVEKVGPNEKPYLCDLCSKTFASKSGLRFHLKSHTGSKPHLCRFCDKGFAILSYKQRHERIHVGDKRFVCHVCSAAFASTNGFKYHLRSHTGEANYRCETCGKCFARCKYLKEHLFTHTGERPFACKICGSAYANSGSLFAHEKKCKTRCAPDNRVAKDCLT